ncbi:MAG: XdhC family protein [Spirochaetaceae bacterium]|jgi:xanthine dehydrogenase accessory factor|nr:XdhC family protein [Spirochaetaceae bacterium]
MSSEKIYQQLSNLYTQGGKAVLVTVVEKKGQGPVETGKKMLVQNHALIGTVGGGSLEHRAIDKARDLLERGKNLLESYVLKEGAIVEESTTLPMICGGKVTLFYEYISGGIPCYIFGAGHIGAALADELTGLGFYSHVVDHRQEIIEHLKSGNQKTLQDLEEFVRQNDFPQESYILICTHSHHYDFLVLQALLKKGPLPRYVGMLASKNKKKELLIQLEQHFGDSLDLQNLHCPVGLNLGGQSPKEIALSIAAEMLAHKNGKTNHRHMRDS